MTVLALMTDHTNTRWNIPGFPAASVGMYPQYTTATANFNSSFARCGILSRANESMPVIDIGSNKTDFWLHFDLYIVNNIATAGAGFVEFWSEGQTLQLGMVENTMGMVFSIRESTDGSTFAAAYAGTFTVAIAVVKTIDIRVKLDASVGEILVYVDESLVFTYTGNTLTNGDNAVRYILFRGGGTGNRYISQAIVADTSTLGWKVQSLAPVTGAQDFSAWSGTYADIDDITSSGIDSVYTDTADSVASFPIQDVASAASSAGMIIQAVQVAGRFLAETGAAVENVEVGFSLASTFWGSPTKSVGADNGEILVSHIFQSNPSNSSGWTYSDVDNAQMALKAKA